ncbi:DMT family transporter [Lysinibacillus sphaericus]
MNIIIILFTLLAGILLSAQSSINGTFSKKAGTLESAFLTFSTGTLVLIIILLFFGRGDVLALLDAPKWQLSAVLFGVGYLFLTVLAVPVIGVTAANISTVIGQLAASMLIDHFGWFGGIEIPLDWKRWLALFSMMLALYFVYKGNTTEKKIES